jgi:hypothetical protein
MSIPAPQQNNTLLEFIDKWLNDKTFVMQFPILETRLAILKYVYSMHKPQESTITQTINYDTTSTNNTNQIKSK